MSKDSLGVRMKDMYESRTKTFLPRRTYTIIRIDGKAFHTFTKGFDRPYDADLMSLMDYTAQMLLKNIQGALLAYVQSDEISLVLTDFENEQTDAWFDGNIQKITSISASLATAFFNAKLTKLAEPFNMPNSLGLPAFRKYMNMGQPKIAFFDSRVFTIPNRADVFSYLVWRQQDATRNSIQMAAQSMFSHKECEGKNTSVLQEMMFSEKGINWNDYPDGFKRGRIIIKQKVAVETENGTAMRTKALVWAAPIFTQNKEAILVLLPKLEA